MKKSLVIFLQSIVVLVGIVVLIFMLWEPHIEGRNLHATLFEIYFKDTFLIYAYFASIPFFVGLYQTFKILKFTRQNKLFSLKVIKALRNIQYCAVATICFAIAGENIFILYNNSDDRAGGVFMGFLICFISLIVGLTAVGFEKKVKKSM